MKESMQSILRSFLSLLLTGIWVCLSAILSTLKALFFMADEDAHGVVIRTRFSLTRSAFSMATFLVLFRMFFAGWDIERIYISPLPPAQQTVSAKKTPKQSKKESLRAWITVKGYKGKPLSSSELWMYLILVALYYFHRDINRGSEKGLLSDLIQLYIQANALRKEGISFVPVVDTSPPVAANTPPINRKPRQSSLPSVEQDPFA